MNYPYSDENRLNVPHSYMYAPYGGQDFLAAYVEDRRARLARHLQGKDYQHMGELKAALSSAAHSLASAQRPDSFSPEDAIALQPLLAALLGVLASGDHLVAQPWLALVIQRFEVSKKLYASYAPGFRKGEGQARDPARYAELALCLALVHMLSGHLQSLSTLLKLNDLLLSLDVAVLSAACPPGLLALLVAAELDGVTAVAAAQGVTIDVA